jgi:hypothetical protein
MSAPAGPLSVVMGAKRPRLVLLSVRAAAAGHHFQTLDFLAHGFVEDGVGQEDQPARGERGERTERLASPTDVVGNMLW